MIAIVVAYSKNRCIGSDGKIPWRILEDLAHFKALTYGHPVIMGRKTWDSIPSKFRPLEGRTNIVITSRSRELNQFYFPTAPVWASSLSNAIRLASIYQPGSDIFIIGGGRVYSDALSMGFVDRVVASELFAEHSGDVFFPELVGWERQELAQYAQFNIVEYRKPK